ncbi:hypothetical protein PPERSA_10548 [Pseudocohnilembus persalinus]|uniref:Amine oxidase domain-containing protein n=1 Tax=Pseudocohnilembus persalinus TaxID=266149 RepID=A0A0V0QM05_PSEPJ|nr:hypothetical protein PPERSA_10548 [Pseudocohnilembus persalinus]|eukprot:KRX03175.1 hypothetical protein PPERSA_10548 [Pseudocohnilembus persalinus]
MKSIAILGERLSGLSTAFYLKNKTKNFNLTIFDKSPKIQEGRQIVFHPQNKNQENHKLYFDQGTNFILLDLLNNPKDKEIYNQIFEKNEIFSKNLSKINKPVYFLDNNNQIIKNSLQGTQMTYKNGLTEISEKIAKTLENEIKFNTKINTILKPKDSNKWEITYQDIKKNQKFTQNFDLVLVGLEPLTLLKILKNNQKQIEKDNKKYYNNNQNNNQDFKQALNSLQNLEHKQNINISLNFQIPKALIGKENINTDFSEFFALMKEEENNDIDFIVVENDKPGHIPDLRGDDKFDFIYLGLNIQMSNEWTEQNINKEDELIIIYVLEKISKIITNDKNKSFFNPKIIQYTDKIFKINQYLKYKEVTKWSYSMHYQLNDLNQYIKNQDKKGIYFCYDILNPQPNIINQITKGIKMGKVINQTI